MLTPPDTIARTYKATGQGKRKRLSHLASLVEDERRQQNELLSLLRKLAHDQIHVRPESLLNEEITPRVLEGVVLLTRESNTAVNQLYI